MATLKTRHRLARGLVILSLVAGAAKLPAQIPSHKFARLGLADGLGPSSITCILQDRHGFMWFGSYDGLIKYDGYDFTLYKNSPLDSNSISDNNISAIYEDTILPNTLWIGTIGGGLNKFDRDKKQFTRFLHDDGNPHRLSHNRVFAIYEDRAGILWIGTARGLDKVERTASTSSAAAGAAGQFKNVVEASEVRAIVEDPRQNGTFWLGTADGLLHFDKATGKLTRFAHDPKDSRSLSDNRIRSLYADQSQNLWIGTPVGLNKIAWHDADSADHQASVFTRFLNDSLGSGTHDIRTIYEDEAGTLWFGAFGGGLFCLNREERIKSDAEKLLTHFVHDPKDLHSLSENRILSLYEDRGGTLWIGTNGGRLNKWDRGHEQFTHLVNEPNYPNRLSHHRIWAIAEDAAGALWLGTQAGLTRLRWDENQQEQSAHFFHDPKNPQSLSSNIVRAISEDSRKDGTLWIGTQENGLNRFDPQRQQFARYLHDPQNPNSLSSNLIRVLYEDSRGENLWIGTYDGGLNKFDYARRRFTRYLNDPQNPHSLSHNRVWAIYEDGVGTLWVGTSGGLNKFDRAQEKFSHYVHDAGNPHSLSHNAVFAIYEDRAVPPGGIWLGTYGGGLNKFDRRAEKFSAYTLKEGLANDDVYGILEDDQGYLWLSTNDGLSRFDPKTAAFKNYDETDGLQGHEFNAGAYFKNKKGEMFFGGVNGFNVFHPERARNNPYVPPVVITAFNVFDKPAPLARAVEALETLTLSHADNFFSFEFAALSYTNSQKNQYAYKLEGFDQDWIYRSSKTRYASYTNLDPGQYVFRVKGSNDDGVWNETGTTIAITITPPWWRTRGAYAFYALSLITGIYAANRFQRRRLLQKTQMREAEWRAQTAEAQSKVLQAENERTKNVELLSAIGKEITSSLDFETIFYKLYEHVNRLAEATIFGVGIYHAEKNLIEYKLAIQNGKRYAPYTRDTADKNQFPVWCIEQRQPVFINDVAEEYRRYISEYKDAGRLLEDGTRSEAPQSLIYLPLLTHDEVLGVITIQSFQKNAYTDYHLNILQNLAAYTTIALDNANAYRRLNAALENLQATQQQLIAQEKLASLGMLTAGIAHEIKNPLNFVNNFAVLSLDLSKELRDLLDAQATAIDAKTRESIEDILAMLDQNMAKINEHGKRADSIVKGMLLHSRGLSGERRPADINAILDEYVALAYHSMRGQDATFNIKIEKNYDTSIERIEVAPQDLSRAFLNIVSNACYATHEKAKGREGDGEKGRDSSFFSPTHPVTPSPLQPYTPTLSVRTKNLGDQIEIRIRDNGIGMPQKILDKIFNPFFTTKPAGQGTGLGLSITYDIIVQEHRGELRVETEEGKFTEFVVRLPKA